MNVIDLIPQIGVAELVKLVDAQRGTEAAARAAASLPQASADAIDECLAYAAGVLAKGPFEKIFLVQPEVLLLEKLAGEGFGGEVSVCLAREIDDRSAARIERNVPSGLDVRFVREGDYPSGFAPRTGALVAFGIPNGDQAFLPATAARIVEEYADFTGEKVLVDCSAWASEERPLGWSTKVMSRLFTSVIR